MKNTLKKNYHYYDSLVEKLFIGSFIKRIRLIDIDGKKSNAWANSPNFCEKQVVDHISYYQDFENYYTINSLTLFY